MSTYSTLATNTQFSPNYHWKEEPWSLPATCLVWPCSCNVPAGRPAPRYIQACDIVQVHMCIVHYGPKFAKGTEWKCEPPAAFRARAVQDFFAVRSRAVLQPGTCPEVEQQLVPCTLIAERTWGLKSLGRDGFSPK